MLTWLKAFVGGNRVWIARVLAVIFDVLQVGLFPLLGPGALSPLNNALDVVAAAAFLSLLGWHWAFLPAIGLETLPIADAFPTWSAAVFFVTRRSSATRAEGGRGLQTAGRARLPE